jgi:GntR family transcriptional repressor for pyruvate dehydrogenase complex
MYLPIKTPKAFQHVCAQIRAQLASGTLKPGDRLPPEHELSISFGVSRGVIREALRSLEIAGLLGSKRGGSGGAYILGGDPANVSRAFQDMLYAGTISLGDFTEARILTLENVIKLACERATEDDFDAIESNIKRTEEFTRAQDYERRLEMANEFYRLLAASTKNQVLVVSIDALTAILQRFLEATDRPPLDLLIEARMRFLKHLKARNVAKATREMTTYLTGLHQHILSAAEHRKVEVQQQKLGRAPVK